jgi:membrane protein DedA with SNARE-associated domain
MKPSRFLPLNAIAAIAWALVYAGAAYLLGPDIAGGLEDVGAIVPLAVAAVVIGLLVLRRLSRPRRVLRNRKMGLREG